MDSIVKVFVFLSAIIFILARLRVLAQLRSPPYFVRQPPNTGEILFEAETGNLHSRRPFLIPCEAIGNPKPNYFWTKNGQRFNWTSQGNRIFEQLSEHSLVITPEDGDAGQYQCFAENIWGVATSNSISVRKAYLESFKNTSLEKYAFEGLPFNLSCDTPNGYPKPNVVWFKLDSSDMFTLINDSRISVDPTGTLWFSNITQQDATEGFLYTCAVLNFFINQVKLGNKVKLHVVPTNSSSEQNKVAPVDQYTSEKVQVAISNKSVILYCIFGGTPLPTVTWKKNGKSLQLQGGISLTNNGKYLVIKNVTLENEGSYSCHASNGIGDSISHTIDLKVQVEPYFIKKPKSITVAEEENVEFHCEAAGNPTPTITWIHNGKPLSEASFNPRRAISSNSMVIEKVQLNDTGNYGCNVTNTLGYVYQDAYINVLAEPPKIELPGSDRVQEAVEGSTVEISYRATGWPEPHITWIRNGSEVIGKRFTTTKTYGDWTMLTISNITHADTGEYTCLAQNKISSDNVAVNVIVRRRTLIPPGYGPSDIKVPVGKPATFRCSTVGDESLPTRISWFRGEVLIDFDLTKSFIQTNDGSLVIPSTTKTDSGKYICFAQTPLDSVTAEATLTVE